MIVISGIEKTPLDKNALEKVVKKYIGYKNRNKNISIFFVNNISDYGNYVFHNRRHIIKISASHHKHENGDFNNIKKLNERCQTYEFLSTILHEIKHVLQRIEIGGKSVNDSFILNNHLKPIKSLCKHYSKCELGARMFEAMHILEAVAIYERTVKENKKAEKCL